MCNIHTISCIQAFSQACIAYAADDDGNKWQNMKSKKGEHMRWRNKRLFYQRMQKTIQHSHYIYNQKLIHVFACYFIGCGYNAPVWCVCVV